MKDETQVMDSAAAREKKHPVNDVVAGIYRKSQELCRQMAAAEGPRDSIWFRNLLLGILNSAVQDFRSIEIGAQRMPALAAWGARNLLELRAITIHVLKSESNAAEFRDEFLSDLKEFYQTLAQDTIETHKRLTTEMEAFATTQPGPVMETLLSAAKGVAEHAAAIASGTSESALYQEVVTDFGIDPERTPKTGKPIARLIGKSESFGLRYKIYSKFAHRTALAIASNVMEGSLDEMLPLLATQANMDLFAIYSAIDNHLKAYGYQPKSTLWGNAPRS